MSDQWQKEVLQQELLDLFKKWDLDVGVGLTKDGVAIRSQTDLVDATNIGYPETYIDLSDAIRGNTLTLMVTEDGDLEVVDPDVESGRLEPTH